MEEYESNSFASKEKTKKEKKETARKEMVVSTPAKVVKKTGLNKITGSIISEDGKKVKDYILLDVLIPALKNIVSDVVTNSINMLLYGEAGRGKSNLPANRVSYGAYYQSQERNRPNGGYTSSRGARQASGYNYDDIILNSRGDADAVLYQMDDVIARYGFVKVADLYEFTGLPSNYTDNNYGWTDLRGADVIRQRDGYLLKLPRPMPID